jgi:hypothetical protein
MEILSYDRTTGDITFTEELKYYHYGASTSTEDDYNGVDIRGEVVMLSRNVRIIGNDTDSWGGQVLVSDNIEIDGTVRNGQLIMDSVELYNCSQGNTFKSAIRFEGVNTEAHSITNSAIWGNLGWGWSAMYSSHIFMQNNAIIGGYQMGLAVVGSHNVTID